MKVGIVGSRNYPNREIIEKFIKENFSKDDVLVSGGAKGVDSWAQECAEKLGIKTEIYYPDYEKYGKPAPLMRNTVIVAQSNQIVAFWDGISTGTLNTVTKCKKTNKPYKIFGPDGTQLR